MTDLALKSFKPGSTGWCADDLDDPVIDAFWNQRRYEIVEGVLTLMPPAMFDGGVALFNLLYLLRQHIDKHRLGGRIATEADIILDQVRVPVADAVWLTDDDERKQKDAHAKRGRRPELKYGRIVVPPTLIIESISQGHERHDRDVKRRWYAEAHIPNYWLLDAQQRTLDCLVLDGPDYRPDQSGRDDAELRPSLFPGLVIPLGQLWAE
jgi:Uma2 family endonuclease